MVQATGPELGPSAGLVDALVHLDDPRLHDVPAALEQAHAAGVWDVISAGVEPRRDNLFDAAALGPSHPHVWAATGLHPMYVRGDELAVQLDALEKNLAARPYVAVGEIGLDARSESTAQCQEHALKAQLAAARRHRLPVILHCVRRIGPLLKILQAAEALVDGALLHGFAGPPDVVSALLELNVSLSFGARVLAAAARRCRQAAAMVPLNRLLVETDAPDVAAAHLPQIVRELAALRDAPAQQIAEQTAANARELYKLPELKTPNVRFV